jgi:hypothetical protein
MINKLEKFKRCFVAMGLDFCGNAIINVRGDVIGEFDGHGTFHSKDEYLRGMVKDFLSVPSDVVDEIEGAKKSKAKRKRAHNKDGTFKADDPSTPDVDEAWEQ